MLSILGGLLLACYVHDPAGVESRVRESRSSLQMVSLWMSPSNFQAALLSMTR